MCDHKLSSKEQTRKSMLNSPSFFGLSSCENPEPLPPPSPIPPDSPPRGSLLRDMILVSLSGAFAGVIPSIVSEIGAMVRESINFKRQLTLKGAELEADDEDKDDDRDEEKEKKKAKKISTNTCTATKCSCNSSS